MLGVLTHLSKLDRVSRIVDPATFNLNPGQWAEISSDGSLVILGDNIKGTNPRLVMGNPSDNAYEGHDVKIGRITTIESFDARIEVDSEGFAGTVNAGDILYVSALQATKGKLVTQATITASESAGWYVAVAKAESVVGGKLTYVTVAPITRFEKQ